MQWIYFAATAQVPKAVDPETFKWVTQLGPAGALLGIALGMLKVFMTYNEKRETQYREEREAREAQYQAERKERDDEHREERKETFNRLATLTDNNSTTLREAITVMTKVVRVVDGLQGSMERTEVRRDKRRGDTGEHKTQL